MKIYFTTNEKYYSKLMRWIFKEPVSHVGVGFFSGPGTNADKPQDRFLNLVIDCTKPFGKLYHMRHWLTKYDLVFWADIKLSEKEELDCYKDVARHSVLATYDWGAYYYGFLQGIKRFLLGGELPKVNKWASKKHHLCTELLEAMKTHMYKWGIDIQDVDLSAVTPFMLANIIKERSRCNKRVRWYGLSNQKVNKRKLANFSQEVLPEDTL